MYLRALRVCSPRFFDQELLIIKQIGDNLKYPSHILQSAYQSAKNTFYRLNDNCHPVERLKNTLVLPFNPNLFAAKSLLKKLNISLVFTYNDTIKNYLIKNSPSTEISGCIYKIPCKDCNKFYIGQTSKKLEQRIKQHKYDIRCQKNSNALFCHKLHTDHDIDFENSIKVKSCDNFLTRNAVESAVIQYTSDLNFNLSAGWFSFDKIMLDNIIKQLDFDNMTTLSC